MERFPTVRIPWEFFEGLYPFNAQLLNGNAMLVRAFGTQPKDGSFIRSREYILFGQGMATLLSYAKGIKVGRNKNGYIVEIMERRDRRGVKYWEVQSVSDQELIAPYWSLVVSDFPPVSDEEGHVRTLIGVKGDPGEYFFLTCPAQCAV